MNNNENNQPDQNQQTNPQNQQTEQPSAAVVQDTSVANQQTQTGEQQSKTVQQPLVSSNSGNNPKNNKTKKLTLIFGAVLGVALISAATVFGYVLPNQPENILKDAFMNTSQETKVAYDGTVSMDFLEEDAPIKALNIGLNGQADADNNAYEINTDITMSGVTIPFESRFIDKSMYVKLGDISTIKSLAKSYAPGYGSIIDEANTLLADQWIEIDETLLKQAEMDCALDVTYSLTETDREVLSSAYSQSPFLTVNNVTDSDVDGRSAYVFDLTIDPQKAQEYGKSFKDISFVKQLSECTGEELDDMSDEDFSEEEPASLMLWVDKDTRTVSKIAAEDIQDSEETEVAGSYEMTFTYGEANIEKPANARPAVEVMAELQQLLFKDMYGGSALGANTDDNGQQPDQSSDTLMQLFQDEFDAEQE